MDRKTFIKHIAFAVVMLFGVSTLIKLVSSMNKGSMNLLQISDDAADKRTGYGRIGYGTRLEKEA